MDKTMRKWRAYGPSGPIETMATTRAKAMNNIRYRLHTECGMSRYDAWRFDLSDLKPVSS